MKKYIMEIGRWNTNNKLYNNTKYWLEKKENKKIKNIIESEIVEIEKEYLEIVR